MGFERAQETQRRAKADEFSRQLTKIAVAQVCEAVGFQQIRDSALESLADVAVHYVLQLGKNAKFYACLTGRANSNLFDIVLGLEDLGGGKVGLESEKTCVTKSGKLKEIADFVKSSGENEASFSQPFPRFPVVRSDASKMRIPSFTLMGETPPSKHIPEWLPAFPDPHTYRHTPVWVERASDPRGDKIEQAKQRRKAERALLSLQQRLVGKASELSSVWGEMNFPKEESREAEAKPNVLLKPELADKDDLVNGSNSSVLEAFAPAIEAAKDGLCDDGERKGEKGAGAVRFKLRTRKKLLEDPLELTLQKKGEGKGVPSVREEERDDKRKRAEFILRHCIENPMDLNQL